MPDAKIPTLVVLNAPDELADHSEYPKITAPSPELYTALSPP